MKTTRAAVLALLGSLASAQDLPPLPNELCDYDTIYNSIKTGNVVDVTLHVRYRNCPANRGNKPCRASNSQGFAPGPLLDGVQTDNAIMIENEIPGPEIRATLGDTVRVTVVNLLGEPTTMHFHGITQFRTPFMDGDASVSNCPIANGANYTYEFVAHPAGSTFYHSHVSSQRISGMTGPLIIEDPAEPYAEVPDKVVFLQDWYHQNSDNNFEFWAQNWPGNCITFGGDYFSGKLNPRRPIDFVGAVVGDGYFFQSFIVNGKGMYEFEKTQVTDTLGGMTFQEMQCPGQLTNAPRCEYCMDPTTWKEELCTASSSESTCGAPSVVEVEAGVQSRLRFIHGGALYAAQVCVDGHAVEIVAADGAVVEPYSTDCFIIFAAERYDVIITPPSPGDFLIRFTTLDQQTAAAFNPDTAENSGIYTGGFPHHGYSILRVTGAEGYAPSSALADTAPMNCGGSITTNCGPDYWLSAKTVGCSEEPSRQDPTRCVTTFNALKADSSPNDDASLCGDLKMAHEVDPTVRSTAAIGFIPDEVPRWEGLGLNARIELLPEDTFGFPYFTPDDPNEWGPHQPISHVDSGPTLSLSPEVREKIYAKRTVARPANATNAGELFPNYPESFSQIVSGVNVLSVKYGDVLRMVFTCAEPYGPGCAMPHPMHLHGNKMAVLYAGEWNTPYDESKFSSNPVYRDTVVVNTDGYVVVQVLATNPGVWRWHCHVNIHHRGGMAFLLDVGGDEAVEAVRATPENANLCPIQPAEAEDVDFRAHEFQPVYLRSVQK